MFNVSLSSIPVPRKLGFSPEHFKIVVSSSGTGAKVTVLRTTVSLPLSTICQTKILLKYDRLLTPSK